MLHSKRHFLHEFLTDMTIALAKLDGNNRCNSTKNSHFSLSLGFHRGKKEPSARAIDFYTSMQVIKSMANLKEKM